MPRLTRLDRLLPRYPRVLGGLLLLAGLIAALIALRGTSLLLSPIPDVGQHVARHMRHTYAQFAALDTLLKSMQFGLTDPRALTALAVATDHLHVRLEMLSGLTRGPFVEDGSRVKELSARLMQGLDHVVAAGLPMNGAELAELSEMSAKIVRDTGDYTRDVEAEIDRMLAERAARAAGAWIDVVASLSLLLILSVLSLALFLRNRRIVEDLRRANGRDSLTGLANRRGFEEWSRRLATAVPVPHAVMVFDLDHFKFINDRRGHAAGDAMLRATADWLKAGLGLQGIVARWGGDEFVAALPLPAGGLAEIESRLTELVRSPPQANGPDGAALPPVRLSCGLALWPDHGETLDKALLSADAALYKAKATARGRHVLFSPEIARSRRLDEDIRLGLAGALRSGEIQVEFEPRYCLNRRALVGAQAQPRWWPDFADQPITPAVLDAAARDMGLLQALDHDLLAQACAAAAAWRSDAGARPVIAVRLSETTLQESDAVEHVRGLLDRHALEPARLEIELRETTEAAPSERALEVLATLGAAGVRLSLGRLASDTAPLALLSRVRPQVLRLPRSVLTQGRPSDRRAIIAGLADLADTFGAKTLIEGLASQADLELATAAACALGQGPHLAAPVPLSGLADVARHLPPLRVPDITAVDPPAASPAEPPVESPAGSPVGSPVA